MNKDGLVFESKTMPTEVYAAWLLLVKEPPDDFVDDLSIRIRNMFEEMWGKRLDKWCNIETTLDELTFTPVDK